VGFATVEKKNGNKKKLILETPMQQGGHEKVLKKV